jgi:biliverdin reductase
MLPIKVGLVGTGYAAKLRAEALQNDARAHLVAVAGHTPDKIQTFSQTYAAEPASSWEALVARSDIDLVMVANVNSEHGRVVRSALAAGKHVVVEYPLALEVNAATELLQLALTQGKLLHVEHIELLSGIHQTAKEALVAIGVPFYVRYSSLNPQRPAPQKWTYDLNLFGFPLVGAVSRIHRLIDLFGEVATVSCQARFWGNASVERQPFEGPYTSCLCTAQLRFMSGLIAEVVYGKGEAIWQAERSLEIQGQQGAVVIEGQEGTLIQADQTRPLSVGSRRGLFARDTTLVLDHLTQGTPLYLAPQSSLYALRVADAARRSAAIGQTIALETQPERM